jgi:integrase/recombinase XerC
MARRPRDLVVHVDTGSFESFVEMAMKQISMNPHTASAYRRDVARWLDFCRARGVNPRTARRQEVAQWIEGMTAEGVAPKTRGRRISSLCSVYRELRRELTDKNGEELEPYVKVKNPFSVDDGPRRLPSRAKNPTQVARPDVVKKLLDTCDDSPLGIRDQALIRLLWATGIRRASAIAMTIERLEPDREGFRTIVDAKRGKQVPILIRGRSATALESWLAILKAGGFTKGPIWRKKEGLLTERGVWWMLNDRSKLAKLSRSVSPHMLRVAFLTYNKASLEAKQEAAGHSDPSTTRGYDRTAWRGREAFEGMPEIEEVP